MACNPARWLWGLIPILALTAATVAIEQGEIERDLGRRASEALAQDNQRWASATFSGRDAVLSGTASEHSETKAAVEALKRVWGVRTIKERVALVDRIDAYFWTASLKDGSVRLSGHVPAEAIRKAIVGVAKANFPKVDVEDKMKLAQGAPARDTWLGGVSFGLKQLAGLKRGSVELKGTELYISGEAEDATSYATVKTALQSGLPQGIRLAAERITPPVVSPYVWAAKLGPNGLVVSGYVPGESLRQQLFLEAKRVFPSVALVDRMRTADGAPLGFAEATTASFEQLAHIKDGSVEVRDAQLSIAGHVEAEADAEAIRSALKARVPPTMKLSDALKVTAAPVPPPAPPAPVIADPPAPAGAEPRPEPTVVAREASADASASTLTRSMRPPTPEPESTPTPTPEQRTAAAAPETPRPPEDPVPPQRRAEADKCQQMLQSIATEGRIQFERASAEIDPRSLPALAELARIADICPTAQIIIEGHTDAEGPPDGNLVLSQRRAQSVVDYLAKAGVSGARMSAVGYGAERPIAPNDTADNRARNRRIEFTVKPN